MLKRTQDPIIAGFLFLKPKKFRFIRILQYAYKDLSGHKILVSLKSDTYTCVFKVAFQF